MVSLLPTTHIPEYEENRAAGFGDAVLGADGLVYGIRHHSRRLVRLDPKDDSITEFGPNLLEFGDPCLRYGVLAEDGFIYVIQRETASMLKIDTNQGESNGTVTSFEVVYGDEGLPTPLLGSGVAGPDGCLYFPFSPGVIVRFDPRSRQATFPSSLRSPVSLSGGICIRDNRLVALAEPPNLLDRDPDSYFVVDVLSDRPTFSPASFRVINSQETSWKTIGGGVFGQDGQLYFLNFLGQMVRLDILSGRFTHRMAPFQFLNSPGTFHWEFGRPCLGIDGCIYWPPKEQERVLMYDPFLETLQFVGESTIRFYRWSNGVTAPNGKTYFFPVLGSHFTPILVVDPLGDFQNDFDERMERDPFRFGGMFDSQADKLINGLPHTAFNVGVLKFGMDAMIQMLDDRIQKNEEVFNRSGCPAALWAALCDDCPLDALYHMTRKSIGELKHHLENSI